jgi:hypothetical protein
MQVIYTGKEKREFGGRIMDQKFRVPVATSGEPRLVEFISFNADGDEEVTTVTNRRVGDALIVVTSDAPRAKDRELVFAAYEEPDSVKSPQAVQGASQVVTPAETPADVASAHAGAKTPQQKRG